MQYKMAIHGNPHPLVPNSFSPHKTFKAFYIITLCLSHNIVKSYKNHFSVNSPDSAFLNILPQKLYII